MKRLLLLIIIVLFSVTSCIKTQPFYGQLQMHWVPVNDTTSTVFLETTDDGVVWYWMDITDSNNVVYNDIDGDFIKEEYSKKFRTYYIYENDKVKYMINFYVKNRHITPTIFCVDEIKGLSFYHKEIE